MAKVPCDGKSTLESDEIFAFLMKMNKAQKMRFKASVSPLPIKGDKFSTIRKNY